jgi:hypothetical protein
MERIANFFLNHKRTIVAGSAVVVAVGIGLNIYYSSSTENDKFIIYTENHCVENFFPKLQREIQLHVHKFIQTNKNVPLIGQMIYQSVLSIYATTLCYMIFKVQINIINQLIFVREKDISYAKQHQFIHDIFNNWFLKDILVQMSQKIGSLSLKEFTTSIPLLNEDEINICMVNIRSKFEDTFEIVVNGNKDEMSRILDEKLIDNLDTFYTAYQECLEGVFGMYMQRVGDSILLGSEEECVKSLQCEVDSMCGALDLNKYISFVDKMQKLSMFCLMVYES